MKTKPSSTKILFALAVILCCIFSVNSFGQNPGPDKTDFYGTWLGTDQNGNTVQIVLNTNETCQFLINSAPDHAGNPIASFRLPEYLSNTNTNTSANTNAPSSDANPVSAGNPTGNSSIAGPERTIKFYTQNGLQGILATVTPSPHDPPPANPDPNAITLNKVPQIYTGLALISVNGSGQYEMALYIDMNQFSSVPPAVDFSMNPAGDIPAFANLVRQ